jgi:hypothetical protein
VRRDKGLYGPTRKQMESAVVRGDVTFLGKICEATSASRMATAGRPVARRFESRTGRIGWRRSAKPRTCSASSTQFRSSFMEMLRSLTDGIEPDIKPGIRNNANS